MILVEWVKKYFVSANIFDTKLFWTHQQHHRKYKDRSIFFDHNLILDLLFTYYITPINQIPFEIMTPFSGTAHRMVFVDLSKAPHSPASKEKAIKSKPRSVSESASSDDPDQVRARSISTLEGILELVEKHPSLQNVLEQNLAQLEEQAEELEDQEPSPNDVFLSILSDQGF